MQPTMITGNIKRHQQAGISYELIKMRNEEENESKQQVSICKIYIKHTIDAYFYVLLFFYVVYLREFFSMRICICMKIKIVIVLLFVCILNIA